MAQKVKGQTEIEVDVVYRVDLRCATAVCPFMSILRLILRLRSADRQDVTTARIP